MSSLPSSNISLLAIQAAMGGESPARLGEYYNTIGSLAHGVSGVASSGALSMASFASKSKNLAFGTAVRSTTSFQSYTTVGSYSYTIPTSGYYMIEAIGGGGGGGTQYNGWVAGGGGGGGGYACGIRWLNSGSVLNITVGAGGAGGPGVSPGQHRDGSAASPSFVTLSGGPELVRGGGGGPGLGQTGTTGGAGGTATASSTMGATRLFRGGWGAAAYLVEGGYHNGGGGGSAGNFFGPGAAGVANTSNAVGGPAIVGYLNTGRGGNGYYYSQSAGLGSVLINEPGQGIGAGSGGGHDTAGAYAGSGGAVRISQVFYYGNDSVKTVFQPKFWLRASDLGSLAHLAEISSWTCFDSNIVATGQKAGTMTTLPIFHKTTEAWPFVRMNTTTGLSTAAGGSFFNLGSHVMNMATGGGWTLVVAFRYTAECYFGRIIDFGNGENNNNIIAYRSGSSSQLAISYRNGSTASDNGMSGSTITGNWQIGAFKYTGTSATYFSYNAPHVYETSKVVTSVPLNDKTLSLCYIGRSHWTTHDSFANLDLRELLFFDSALDDARMLEIMAYLYAKSSTNGLIFHVDPSNYNGGNVLYSLVGMNTGVLGGNYSYLSSTAGGTMRLTNTSGDMYANTSHLQLPTLSNVRTVSIWYLLNSSLNVTRYLIDARSDDGAGNGWVYNDQNTTNGFGGLWTQFYINGGAVQGVSSSLVPIMFEQTGAWRHVTLISNVAVTDNITLFARFPKNEGLDVTFGAVTVYDRVLTESENRMNYNATRGRYGV